MKNKIALASAFFAAASISTAEIVVNDFLSFEGFVDMSYAHAEGEEGRNSESENSYALDQVEISWLFDFDTVTAQIDLAYEGSENDEVATVVEQAFVNYALGNGDVVTAGRFASMLGFEAFEPTGLYQYSFAYTGGIALDQLVGGSSDMSVLPGYDQGVKYTQEGESTFFGIALLDGDYNVGRLGGDVDGLAGDSGYAVEAAFAQDLGNGLSYFLGARYDDGDTQNTVTYNAYATYETGAWLFAAEVAYADFNDDARNSDADVLNALLLANYAYSEQASVTGRLSHVDVNLDGGTDADFFKYTIAHNYAFTDNLLLVKELSYVDGESQAFGAASADVEELQVGVELLFTF
jgi:hypothetical protein